MTLAFRLLRTARRTALQAIPTIFVIVTLGFFLLQLAPGDAADYIAAESGSATVESVAAIRKNYGLDQPVLHQLMAYYSSLAHFDLGMSPRYGVPVSDLILRRLPNTLLLMSVSIVFAVALGVLLGTIMASFAGRLADTAVSILSLLFYSLPGFWIGLMLIVLFSVKLGWLPSGGAATIGSDLTGFAGIFDRLRYLVLPAVSLSLYYVAIYARLSRASIIEASSQDHVRTAVAKGLSTGAVMRRHILRNALVPVTTMAGMHVAGVIGGALVIETVFSWPGLGRLAYEAVAAREYTVLLGIMLVSSLVVIGVNALIDLLNSVLDPRVEVR